MVLLSSDNLGSTTTMSNSPFLTISAQHTRTKETVFVDLDRLDTIALAQLLKRITFNDCRSNAIDDSEAYLMIGALDKLAKLLAQAGVAPR